MSVEVFWVLILGVALLGSILSGVPVMLALAGAPVITAFVASAFGHFDLSYLAAFPQRVFGIMNNPLFVAIPLFVLMGILLEQSRQAEKLLTNLTRLMGQTRGKLALAVLLVSTLVAASTGIIGATIVMLGMISLPTMLKAGISPRFSSGLICASGTLGQIIPPSIVLILLGDQISNAYLEAQQTVGNFAPEPVSVGDLFAGALLPGLLLVFLYAAYSLWHLREANTKVLELNMQQTDVSSAKLLMDIVPPVLLIVAVLGSILIGVATPTEAASIGVAGTILIAARNLPNSNLPLTFIVSAMIFGIITAASMLSLVFRGFGGDEMVAQVLTHLPGGHWTLLIITMLTIFVLGFVLEFVEIVFIVIPIVGPILLQSDINPVWFGILVALNIQTSFLTPPFGFALFYYRSVAPDSISTIEIYRSVGPFIAIQLITLGIVIAFPPLATWLPSVLFS